ncbi:MAG TPA: ROK family protein [Planctomycetota bacterium]|jgi:glucokinase|nr:ROK family protein [Planctomycetota bacterium]
MRAVGIDLGGTAIKAGAVSAEGQVLDRRSAPVDAGAGPVVLLDRMAAIARELGASGAIGLGSPGLLDRARGAVIEAPNLHFLEGISLRDELARRLSLAPDAVALENDANVAALAEHWLGAGRGESHLCLVTLGTGVGGGLVLAGELYSGPGGMAGEIGHVVVDPNGPPCGCGARGCLETLASASAARRRALERGLPGDLAELAAAARRSAGPERTLLLEVGVDLGRGLASVLTLLDVRLFVIGGGFGAAVDVLEPGIRKGLAERSYGARVAEVRIVPAALGADAGWIGAARLALSFPAR